MPRKLSTIFFFATLLSTSTMVCAEESQATAPVSGFARSFLALTAIPDAKITILETGQVIHTDENGHFGPIQYPVGKPITMVMEKWGYQTTQSGTVIVPREGLTSPYNNITFQVPSIITYHAMAAIVGAKINDNDCHVTTTVISHNKTLDDIPQGEEGAKISLTPNVAEKPFYFDIFSSNFPAPIKEKTNPFTKGLIQTSKDGGVAFFNLPPRDKPYVLSASKSGIVFSEAQFICRKGMFINISPPLGPMVRE